MKFIFEVSRVEFEFSDGFGPSDKMDLLESRATAEFNEAYQRQSAHTIEASSEIEAKLKLSLEIERQTGWTVRKIVANVVHSE